MRPNATPTFTDLCSSSPTPRRWPCSVKASWFQKQSGLLLFREPVAGVPGLRGTSRSIRRCRRDSRVRARLHGLWQRDVLDATRTPADAVHGDGVVWRHTAAMASSSSHPGARGRSFREPQGVRSPVSGPCVRAPGLTTRALASRGRRRAHSASRRRPIPLRLSPQPTIWSTSNCRRGTVSSRPSSARTPTGHCSYPPSWRVGCMPPTIGLRRYDAATPFSSASACLWPRIAVIAAKPGGGPYHLLPSVTVLAYALLRLPAQVWERPWMRSLVAAAAFTALGIAVPRQVTFLETVSSRHLEGPATTCAASPMPTRLAGSRWAIRARHAFPMRARTSCFARVSTCSTPPQCRSTGCLGCPCPSPPCARSTSAASSTG